MQKQELKIKGGMYVIMINGKEVKRTTSKVVADHHMRRMALLPGYTISTDGSAPLTLAERDVVDQSGINPDVVIDNTPKVKRKPKNAKQKNNVSNTSNSEEAICELLTLAIYDRLSKVWNEVACAEIVALIDNVGRDNFGFISETKKTFTTKFCNNLLQQILASVFPETFKEIENELT